MWDWLWPTCNHCLNEGEGGGESLNLSFGLTRPDMRTLFNWRRRKKFPILKVGNIFPMTGQAALIPWTTLCNKTKFRHWIGSDLSYSIIKEAHLSSSVSKRLKIVPILKRLHGMLWVHLQPPAPITNFGPCHAWYWTSTWKTC